MNRCGGDAVTTDSLWERCPQRLVTEYFYTTRLQVPTHTTCGQPDNPQSYW